MLLTGKNAVITGCLKGIGRSTLETFAKNGSNVWACALAPDEEFEVFCQNLAKENYVWIKPVYFNLLDQEQIKSALKQIVSDKQPVHILVNIAGMTKDALFHMIPMDQMKLIFEANFFAQMYITQFITKLMVRQKVGSVINISSISALDGSYGQLSYSASKAAIIGATRTLSVELADKGVRVNALAPGVIDTDMVKAVPEDIILKRINQMSLKRLGLVDEVSNAILFLASDLSDYITGQVIRIDGGIK
jgi:3-oxoacyl-[acyl-carrier protein] reductase